MKELGVSEDEAYKKIHKKSMDLRKTMKEIADAIILSSELGKNLDRNNPKYVSYCCLNKETF